MSWWRGKSRTVLKGFPHHAHYITYCPSSSESKIIFFAHVLWEPYKWSYQRRLIISDRGCDVTCAPIIWIIHAHLSVIIYANLYSAKELSIVSDGVRLGIWWFLMILRFDNNTFILRLKLIFLLKNSCTWSDEFKCRDYSQTIGLKA